MKNRGILNISQKQYILKKYPVCYLCKQFILDTDKPHFDHVQSLKNGGSNDLENIRPTHPICNLRKGAKSM
ncbi:HNH endonuclease [Escherichia coli]|nr:HNH endonuclease [Escherichia coli]EJR1979140.1 HNH endonuclease [Escherichia coli]